MRPDDFRDRLNAAGRALGLHRIRCAKWLPFKWLPRHKDHQGEIRPLRFFSSFDRSLSCGHSVAAMFEVGRECDSAGLCESIKALAESCLNELLSFAEKPCSLCGKKRKKKQK